MITLQTPFKIAVRIKGYTEVAEGRIVENDHRILIDIDGEIYGWTFGLVEAVWFLGQWMTPEQFNSYQ